MSNYITLLISVIHPVYAMTINRYAVDISLDDPRMSDFDADAWAEPEVRRTLLGLLCEDWLTDGCEVVGCEQISGAIQWEEVA